MARKVLVIGAQVHSDIPANPTTASVDVATDVARDARADTLVAIGAGSTLDASKAVALQVDPAKPLPIRDSDHGGHRCGYQFDVIETVDHRTVYPGSEQTVPALVILDTELTVGLPAAVTAACGFDEIIHGIAHSITATLGTPHGVALASIAGPAMRFGIDAAPAAYGDLARALTVESGVAAVDLIMGIATEVGLPTTSGAVGVTSDLIDTIGAKTLEDAVTNNTPHRPTIAELTDVLATGVRV